MAKFVQEGKYIDYKNENADTKAGDVVKIGDDFYGVADRAIPKGTLGVLTVSGVYTFTAKNNVTMGAKMYLHSDGTVDGTQVQADAQNSITGESGNLIGRATNSASSGGVVYVRLN